jgi:hypothetical protein
VRIWDTGELQVRPMGRQSASGSAGQRCFFGQGDEPGCKECFIYSNFVDEQLIQGFLKH